MRRLSIFLEESIQEGVSRAVFEPNGDINNGRLVIEVGFAPRKPAEFMILRIRQKTTGD